MGGSGKKGGRSQPIRKRKKNKQTLAKVAERKEERQQKLERKLAEADSRINAARLSAFAIPVASDNSSGERNTAASSQSSRFHHENNPSQEGNVKEDGRDNDEFMDELDEQEYGTDNGYDKLMQHMLKPLHHDSGKTKACTTTKDSPILPSIDRSQKKAKNQSSSSNNSRVSQNPEETASKAQEFIDLVFKDAEVENRASAVRETQHFSCKLDSSTIKSNEQSNSNYKTVAEWPQLKVSTAEMSTETSASIAELSKQSSMPVSLGLQPTTLRRWQQHPAFERAMGGQASSPLLRSVSVTLRSFHDLLLCANVDAPTEDAIRSMYIAHCVSHVLRCRNRVLKNNAMVNKDEDVGPDDQDDEDEMFDEDSIRDRGFVRARVLIIAPMRNVAYDVVNQIVQLCGGASLTENDGKKDEKNNCKVVYQERFEQEFGPEEDEDEDGYPSELIGDDNGLLKAGAGIRTKDDLSADHSRTFRGNVDDDFKLGISLSKKAIKLYSDFYDSDFIIASPLGLRRTIAAKASGYDNHSRMMREKKKNDDDTEWKSGIDSKAEKRKPEEDDNGFLSSIEVCVVDGADVFSMQNWESLQRTVSMMNNMPKSTRDTDFSRVREFCLDGLMKKFRQSVLLSRYRKSEIMAMFRGFSNHAGKVRIVEIGQSYGSLREVRVPMARQTFFKVPGVQDPLNAAEERLKFFFDQTLPAVRAIPDAQALIVVPSYFDFVKVRNRMVKMEEDDVTFRFSSMCEYSRAKDVVRARSRLFDKSIRIVLMTERFHFFYRHWIRGANTVVWFGVCENAHFYPEIINMAEEAAQKGQLVQSLALYDKLDAFLLERVVGSSRCRRMVSDQSRSTYLFV